MKDLAELASGEFVTFEPVFDNDEKLFGYFTLFNQGEINDKTRKFEYVLLDKNLNKVSSNTFEAEKILYRYSAYLDINKDLILAPYVDIHEMSIWGIGKFTYPEYKKIDLKNNKITVYYGKCYENNTFLNCEPNKSWRDSKKDIKAERKAKGYLDNASVSILKNGKLIVSQFKNYEKYVKDNVIMYFDENEKMIWKYEYNKFADKKNGEFIRIIDIDDNAFYAIKITTINKKKTYKLIVLDINTGKLLAENLINSISEKTIESLTYSNKFKMYDDKIIIFGRSFDDDKLNGYARLLIDKKTYTVTVNTLFYKEDLKQYIPKLDKNGGVESGYNLNLKDAFLLKDGSVAILNEKFKPEGQYNKMKTTDMVYIYTDEDFKVKDVKTLEKEKSKGQYTDYLYSQYLNNDENVVFFYKDFQKDDETKDKNWILFINTLLKGEFKQEQLIISSKNDKFIIHPYIAKEGYILLREFNEKEKYNQIRLEKLNY